jgi:glycerol uptake facilitator-like aquaporin
VLIRGRLRSSEWVAYVATQLVAAVLAALLARAINGARTAGAFASAWKMLVVEFVVTFALAYVVLNVATARGTEGNSFYGLAIGFTVAAGAFAVGGVSGGGVQSGGRARRERARDLQVEPLLDLRGRAPAGRRDRGGRVPLHAAGGEA